MVMAGVFCFGYNTNVQPTNHEADAGRRNKCRHAMAAGSIWLVAVTFVFDLVVLGDCQGMFGGGDRGEQRRLLGRNGNDDGSHVAEGKLEEAVQHITKEIPQQ
ncbi:uncharacterized protein LOC124708407 isoform X2 [Lolium rigidum]|uniref:uncharacterized protein LOC124708407 isoform X2 n=1 Tax=Lolium rigidum TaxID=89674 RepID=UPI001F5D2E44|nr:uncharacterized protein LOC124708407 isoform X2 [Lolium rigidum]